jgi:membrane-associated phospholipid phosphatase
MLHGMRQNSRSLAKLSQNTSILIVLGALFCWLSYNYFDKPIASYFHSDVHPSSLAYSFSQIVTLFGDSIVSIIFIIVALTLGIFILFRQPQSRFANNLLFIAISMIMAIVLGGCFKYLLGRYRPEMLFQEGSYGFHFLTNQYLMNSMPSGHALRAFVLVTGASLIWKRLTPLFIVIGLLVCLSRLVVDCHYLSDVIFGALLGTVVTLWVAKLYNNIIINSHQTYATLKSR